MNFPLVEKVVFGHKHKFGFPAAGSGEALSCLFIRMKPTGLAS